MGHRPGSLITRLVISTAVMLTVALGLAGLSLDRGFRDSARTALQDRLEAHLYGLMGLVQIDEQGAISVPDSLAEPGLTGSESDLYAAIWNGDGRLLWQSPSASARDLPRPAATSRPAYKDFGHDAVHGTYSTSLTVRWEMAPDEHRLLTFTVVEAETRFKDEIAAFRRSLWGGLAASALFLVAAHLALLRLSMKPLLRLIREVKAIEAGHEERFTPDYPVEILPLTRNMNALLDQDRARLARYRDSLADLAHSLKTPLSILHGIKEDLEPGGAARRQMDEQLERMQGAVDYHLQRAAVAGRVPLSGTVEMAPLVAELRRSLDKVYDDRRVEFTADLQAGLRFRGDRGDLMEILGNLMDNAWKWCRGRVRLTLRRTAGPDDALLVRVEDDGPGVADIHWGRLGERGFRPCPGVPGHGIGLAVVRDLAAEYGGVPEFGRSPLGGLQVSLRLAP
ncbi:MAG: ATP-binding protein [Gammaproteobacteria bacterium]|nr:ATP-binding protein [Gammaproteobacteria bacterium]